MKSLVCASALWLTCLTPLVAAEWEVLRDEAGNFSVAFPAKPEKQTQTVDTAVGKVEAVYFLVETAGGKTVYLVGYSDYPQEFAAKAEPEGVLDGARDGNVKTTAGKVDNEVKIKLDGFPGREYTYSGKLNGIGEPVIGNARIFLVGPRLYQIMVLGAADTPPVKEDLAKFYASFQRIVK